MKIEEKDGKKVVIFEGKDDELKVNFLKEMEATDVLLKEAIAANEARSEANTRRKLAVKRLDLHRLENHKRVWGPINEALAKDTGVDTAPGMTYNNEDGLVLSEGRGLPNMLSDLLEQIGMDIDI